MAKGKHSAALFEVIHNGKKPRVAPSLGTPKWWFKSRHPSQLANSSHTPEPEVEEPRRAERVEEDRPEPVEEAPVTRIRPSRGPRAERAERDSGIRFGFNRNNQEFTFKLRYTTALVTAFAVCVLVGLSYVVGRHLGGGPKVASAESSVKELMQQPAQPEVTRVAPKSRVSQNSNPTPRTSTPATTTTEKSTQTAMANTGVSTRQKVVSSFVPASADTVRVVEPSAFRTVTSLDLSSTMPSPSPST